MKSDNEQQDSEKSRENQKKEEKKNCNHTAEIKNTEYFCEISFFL